MLSLSSFTSCQDRMKYLNPVELYNKSIKKTTTVPYNESLRTTTGPFMGLYVGDTQLGVAIADCSKIPIPVSSCSPRTLDMDENLGSALQDLISKHHVSGLVIGYPFRWESLFPTDVSFGMQVKHFVEKIIETRKFEDMNYTFWDSSSTTRMLVHLASLTLKTGRCYYFPATTTTEYAACQILKRYITLLTLSPDPASEEMVLDCQIKMEPSTKGDEET